MTTPFLLDEVDALVRDAIRIKTGIALVRACELLLARHEYRAAIVLRENIESITNETIAEHETQLALLRAKQR